MNRLHDPLRLPHHAWPSPPTLNPLRPPLPPLVSILVPTYNCAPFLADALRSILSQDYPHLEILISDDASADDSVAVIRAAIQADPRVRFVVHPRNLGMVANWNWCLREARGTYIKFLFGDDVLTSPRSVSRLVQLLETHPRATLATSARELIDEHSRPAGVWNHLRTPGWHAGPAIIARCFLSNHNLIGEPSAVLLRRSAIDRGFDPELRQLVDLEMWLRLLQRGDLVYAPEALVAFRVHAAQQTQSNGRQAVGQLETVRLLEQFLGSTALRGATGIGEFDFRFIQFRALHSLRKASPRQPLCLAPAAALARELSPLWQFTCLWRHRLTRPAENLLRSLRKRERPLRLAPAHGLTAGF